MLRHQHVVDECFDGVAGRWQRRGQRKGGKGNPVLEMTEEEGELSPFHAEATPLELVMDASNRVRDVVELAGEFGLFVVETAVSVYLGNCGRVVESLCLFDEGVETPISASEDGEEPWSCCFGNGVLSIVRPEEKLSDIGGFPSVTAALTATPSSDLNTQVESCRDEQEVLLGVCCLQHSQAARDRRKEAEIHKRLRMRNTDEKGSLLIPVQARVGKRARMRPRILLTYL